MVCAEICADRGLGRMRNRGVNEIKQLFDKYGFRFSKSMGQNFLIDGNIPEKMVRLSGISKSDCALEVGPGIGALTEYLSKAAGRVVAVELDRRLTPLLRDLTAELTNVEIIQGDILKLDLKKLAEEKMRGFRHCVCANLPYNITTPALTAFIGAGVFEDITVMIQREVARRVCAGPGSPDYGAFSVYVNYHAEPRILFDVPPECFMPKPAVYSSVLSMKMREGRMLAPEEETAFFRVVRAAFQQRRKTLVNAMRAVYENTLSKEELTGVVEQCGLDARVRGEVLGIEEFVRITRAVMGVEIQTGKRS